MKAAAPMPVRAWLVCLNLQREYVTPGRPFYAPNSDAAVANARRCLQHARTVGWRVAHVQTRRAHVASHRSFARPIEGLEPWPSEPLFATKHTSALAHRQLRTQWEEECPAIAYLIGFSLAHDGLATLLQAADLGLPLRVVQDAVGSPAIGDRSAADIDRAALAIMGSLSALTSSAEILGGAPARLVGFRGLER